jgi:hypothetical protein
MRCTGVHNEWPGKIKKFLKEEVRMKRLMVLVIGFVFLMCSSVMAADKPAAAAPAKEPMAKEEKAPVKEEKKAKKVKKAKKAKKEKKEEAAPAEKPAK